VNKDDMNDDAQFDAFLNGEGDLARRLQALPQPGPSAALDAAILARARAAMAQDSRPAAANDSGDGTLAPRRTPGMGWRWRIPAGIAASVLVGLFAHQTFQQGGELNEVVNPIAPPVPAAPVAQDVEAAAPVPESRPAKAAAAVPEALQKPAAPAKEIKTEKPAASFEFARPAPVAQAEARAEMADLQRQAMTEKKSTVDKSKSDAYLSKEKTAAPLPAPVESYSPAPAPEPAPPQQQEVRVSGRRNTYEPQLSGGLIVAPAAPAPVAQAEPRAWLERIEKLLEQGRRDEALREWKAFRAAYPAYPVPGTTRERLE
jgi:hypothetical protein